jgi:hypothetical protein
MRAGFAGCERRMVYTIVVMTQDRRVLLRAAMIVFIAAFACLLLWVLPIPQHNVGIVHYPGFHL